MAATEGSCPPYESAASVHQGPSVRPAEKILRSRARICAQSTYAHALTQDDCFASVAAEEFSNNLSERKGARSGSHPWDPSRTPPARVHLRSSRGMHRSSQSCTNGGG